MRKVSLGRSTRSIYVSLACLSLALHLLLAFFCLSVLHTSCVLPSTTSTSSSSDAFATAVRQTANQLRKSILTLSLLSPSPSPPLLPTLPMLLWDVKPRNQTATVQQAPRAKVAFGEAAAKESNSVAAKKLMEKFKSQDKLELLFRHRLYNLPRPAQREADKLLLVNSQPPEKDSESYESSETSG